MLSDSKTLETFVKENKSNFYVRRTKEGKLFFVCGSITGSVSKGLQKKLETKQPLGILMVSHTVGDEIGEGYDTPYEGEILHEAPEAVFSLEFKE